MQKRPMDVYNTSPMSKSDVWEEFYVITDCESNISSGVAACKQVLAFNSHKIVL